MLRIPVIGNLHDARVISKVGGSKGKTPPSLATRMPNAGIAAKVGMGTIESMRSGRVRRLNTRN